MEPMKSTKRTSNLLALCLFFLLGLICASHSSPSWGQTLKSPPEQKTQPAPKSTSKSAATKPLSSPKLTPKSLAKPSGAAHIKAVPPPKVNPTPGAGAEAKPLAKTEARKGESREFLWKATRKGGGTIYLLGTIHLVRPDFYPLPRGIEEAFNLSNKLVVEVDITRTDQAALGRLVMAHGIDNSTPDSLFKKLEPETLSLLKDYIETKNLSTRMFGQMQPWLASLTISQMELQRLGFDAESGIDKHFLRKAHKEGMEVLALESEESQISLFSSLSPALQGKMLKLTLTDMKNLDDDASDMIKAWKTGDDKKMAELVEKSVRQYPEFKPIQDKLFNQIGRAHV